MSSHQKLGPPLTDGPVYSFYTWQTSLWQHRHTASHGNAYAVQAGAPT
jgi:hypothetical protein